MLGKPLNVLYYAICIKCSFVGWFWLLVLIINARVCHVSDMICVFFLTIYFALLWSSVIHTAGCPSFNINYPPMRTLLCPGDIITYTCAISSAGFTVNTLWAGSGFTCPANNPSNTITLTQVAGASLNAVPGSCSALSAVMTNISGTCYTSVLTIPTPQYFNGTIVMCRDGFINALIGSDTLNIQLACKSVFNLLIISNYTVHILLYMFHLTYTVFCAANPWLCSVGTHFFHLGCGL